MAGLDRLPGHTAGPAAVPAVLLPEAMAASFRPLRGRSPATFPGLPGGRRLSLRPLQQRVLAGALPGRRHAAHGRARRRDGGDGRRRGRSHGRRRRGAVLPGHGLLLLVLLGHLAALDDHLVEGLHALVQAVAGDGARRLHVPHVRRGLAGRDGGLALLAELVEAQQPLQLARLARAGQVLLVGQHQDGHARVVRGPATDKQRRARLE